MNQSKTLMIQGTASSAGKSIIVTALCRIFRQDGYTVAPFKSQNMALNSFVTAEGGEIGRAQVVQAEAAGIAPTVDMNPVLLKPTTDTGSQVIVMGKAVRNISARDYYKYTPSLLETINGAMQRLQKQYEIVVIEGAGSPAEINLREHEIVNMRIARMFHSPVLLVGDIDKGGVFASLVGTLELLEPEERQMVKGFIINKFRGDVSLLSDALDTITRRTGVPFLGVVPYFRDIRIAQEDSVYLDSRTNDSNGGELNIAVIRLPHISNYDDFDPLEAEGCNVYYARQTFELGNPHLIIIPGTKSTIADLKALKYSGLATTILGLARSGTPIVGICGGYQMLGQKIVDSENVESKEDEVSGLGLLDTTTEFMPEKATTQARARVVESKGLLNSMEGIELHGYEIHMGRTSTVTGGQVFNIIETPQGPANYPDGTMNDKGTILGTYLHGIFHNDEFRRGFINNLREHWGMKPEEGGIELSRDREYDKLADLVRNSLDVPAIYRIMEAMK